MSQGLVEYLTQWGGESIAPMKYSTHSDEVDIFEIWEDTETGALQLTPYDLVKVSMLENIFNTQEITRHGFLLRIAFVPFIVQDGWWQLDLTKDYYDALLDNFGLSTLRRLTHTSGMNLDILPQFSNGKLVGIHYSTFVSNYLGFYFSYEENGSAYGVIWCHNCPQDRHRNLNMSHLQDAFKRFGSLARDPCYPMFVLLVSLLSSIDRRLTRIRREVNRVEAHTGHHPWGELRNTRWRPTSALESRLASYSAELSGSATALASDKRFVKLSMEIMHNIRHSMWLDNLWPMSTKQPLQLQRKHDLDFIDGRLRNQLIQVDVLEARVRNQLSAVQNFDSIRIANDSMNLANTTKILAILTVVFLPATFVATLFSTSIFNWQTPDDAFVSVYFWVYWVVTIPLTVMTVLIFLCLRRRWKRVPLWQDKEAMKHVSNYRHIPPGPEVV